MELRRREFTALLLGAAASFSLAGQADAESDPLPWERRAGQGRDRQVCRRPSALAGERRWIRG
jgi:hypothetical protein